MIPFPDYIPREYPGESEHGETEMLRLYRPFVACGAVYGAYQDRYGECYLLRVAKLGATVPDYGLVTDQERTAILVRLEKRHRRSIQQVRWLFGRREA